MIFVGLWLSLDRAQVPDQARDLNRLLLFSLDRAQVPNQARDLNQLVVYSIDGMLTDTCRSHYLRPLQFCKLASSPN